MLLIKFQENWRGENAPVPETLIRRLIGYKNSARLFSAEESFFDLIGGN